MKIIIKETEEVIADIMTNHSMTLEEAIECAGEMSWNEDDDYMEVIIDGETYDYDDLDIIG